jgi:hypothetical protein
MSVAKETTSIKVEQKKEETPNKIEKKDIKSE